MDAILLLLFYSLAKPLDFFLPIKFFGLSFFSTILPFLSTLFIWLKATIHDSKNKRLTNILFLLCFFCIITLRVLIYQESLFESFRLFLPVLNLLFFLSVLGSIDFTASQKNRISLFLIYLFLFHTGNSLLYIFGLPAINYENVDAEDYVAFSRFSGIMGGSNVQGSIIVFLLLSYFVIKTPNRMSVFLMLMLLSIFGVLPTLSRLSFFGLIYVFAYYLIKYYTSNFIQKFTTIILSAIISILLISWGEKLIFFNQIIERFLTGDYSSGRGSKNSFFHEIFWQQEYFLLGIPHKLQDLGVSTKNISDNSFYYILSNHGLIGMSLILFIFIFYFKRIVLRRSFFVMLLTVLFLWFNNSILWSFWLYLSILVIYIIDSNKNTPILSDQ